ncbi:MAG: CARDB domain-containing protein, partial [Armatimonadota bacterium]
LFPEIQGGRPVPGQALLPTGSYNCALVITEESFHNNYAGGGAWAAAMRNDNVSFAVTAPAVHDVAVTGLTAASNIPSNKNSTVGVSVANKGNAPEAGLQVSLTDVLTGQQLGALPVSSLAAGKSATVSFTWKPTLKGDHTLRASVGQVAGETNLANNTLTKVVRVK